MGFTGFPLAALAFYERLEADNSKEFWAANRATYDEVVRRPMGLLVEDVDERYRPMSVFRPHRDVRFSTDKTPYKTHIGAVGESDGGSMHYVQLSAAGLMAASGYYAMATDQLERFRAAVDDQHWGSELESIIAALRRSKHEVGNGGADALKTAPRGYGRDHPRIELLRLKGLILRRDLGAARWLATRAALARVQAVWAATDPLNAWLDTHVGPSQQPPDERWVR